MDFHPARVLRLQPAQARENILNAILIVGAVEGVEVASFGVASLTIPNVKRQRRLA